MGQCSYMSAVRQLRSGTVIVSQLPLRHHPLSSLTWSEYKGRKHLVNSPRQVGMTLDP